MRQEGASGLHGPCSDMQPLLLNTLAEKAVVKPDLLIPGNIAS